MLKINFKQKNIQPILQVLSGLLIVFFMLNMHIAQDSFLAKLKDRLEWVVYDIRLNATLDKTHELDPRVIIVDIDEKSLQQEGHWPWTREKISRLVQTLLDENVAVIGMDIVFSESELNPVQEILDSSTYQSGLGSPDLSKTLRALSFQFNGDIIFADTIRDQPVVLGYVFHNEEGKTTGQLSHSLTNPDLEQIPLSPIRPFSSFTSNIPLLSDNASASGFFAIQPDLDGTIRRASLLYRYQNKLYPSLALSIVRQYYGNPDIEFLTEEILDNEYNIQALSIGGINHIPTDKHTRVIIPFKGATGSYHYVSATDILNGHFSPSLLEDTIVLIGTTAKGLYDLRATPVESVFPGVEVHANIISAMLDDIFPAITAVAEGIDYVLIIGIGSLFALSAPFLRPLPLLLGTFVLLTGYISLNFWLWIDKGLVTALAIPMILIILISIVNASYGYIFETRRGLKLKSRFDQYVPPALVDEMLQDPDNDFGFEGESREMTVMFCDIRSFTSISEGLTANELKRMLNYFFTPMTEIVFDNRGTIDKYVGDMIMCFWGAPIIDKNHQTNGILAALQMLQKVEDMVPELAAQGWPEIKIGVGLNTGQMNVGDMGSNYRRNYTVIGDAVNLGSRLESLTKFYGVKLIVSAATAEGEDGFIFRPLDKVRVKGKQDAVSIVEPLCLIKEADDTLYEELNLHKQALKHYYAQQWPEAKTQFKILSQAHPERLVYQLFLTRIDSLSEEALPKDWDGAYTHTSK